MKRSILKLLVPVLAVCILVCGLSVPGAAAKPKPFVSWALTPAVNEGAPVPFSWSAKRLGPNHRLVIQRPFGTAKVWKTILKLPTNSGSSALSGISPLGRYRYRIAAFRGKKFLAARPGRVSVFGVVPFETLLNENNPSSYTTATNSFPWVLSRNVYEDGASVLQVRRNNCSSVHVSFLFGRKNVAGTGTVTVVQESADPVSATAPFEQTSSVDTALVPGQTWGINATMVSPEDEVPVVYINGYAVCSSTESFFN